MNAYNSVALQKSGEPYEHVYWVDNVAIRCAAWIGAIVRSLRVVRRRGRHAAEETRVCSDKASGKGECRGMVSRS